MRHLRTLSDINQHAFAIEAGEIEGVGMVKNWVRETLNMKVEANPDIITRTYGLLSVEEARQVSELVAGAPFVGEYKVVIIVATRIYHEAQNSLLKVFEEPPPNTYLFLILPSLGSLLPTLRSRVQVFNVRSLQDTNRISKGDEETVKQFLGASREKRSALIKKLTTGKDEEERRKNREEAIAILNGVEQTLVALGTQKHARTLSEISTLRAYLYDRSAPVRMILEHLALVIPVGVR